MGPNTPPERGPGRGRRSPFDPSASPSVRCRHCRRRIFDAQAYRFAGGAWEHLVCPPWRSAEPDGN